MAQFLKLKLLIWKLWVFKSSEQQFREALGVFKEEQGGGWERLSELYQDLRNLAPTDAARRCTLYGQHANDLGIDFINNLKTVIIPHCDVISNEGVQSLVDELHRMFELGCESAKDIERQAADQLARPHNKVKSIYARVEAIYSGAMSGYRDELQSVINQSNLEFTHHRLQTRKQRITDLGGGFFLISSFLFWV